MQDHLGGNQTGRAKRCRSGAQGQEPGPKKQKRAKITDDQIRRIPAFQSLEAANLNIKPTTITSIYGSRTASAEAYEKIANALLARIDCLKQLTVSGETVAIANISSILSGTRSKAPEALDALVVCLEKNKSRLDELGLPLSNISSILRGARSKAPEALEDLVAWLEEHKSRLDELGLPLPNISSMLHGAGSKAPEALEELVVCLEKNKSRLGELGLPLSTISSMLHSTGSKAPEALEDLVAWLEEHKSRLDELGVPLQNVSSMLNSAGSRAPDAFDLLMARLEEHKPRLDELGVPLSNISSMLNGTGPKAAATLNRLMVELEEHKSRLGELGLPLSNVFSMLHGAGSKAPEALDRLILRLEAHKPRLDELGVLVPSISNMLNGAGPNAPETLDALMVQLEGRLEGVRDIVGPDKPIQFQNISYLLNSAGVKAPEAVGKMLAVIATHRNIIPDLIGKNKPFSKLSSLVKIRNRPNAALKVPERFDLALRSETVRACLQKGQGTIGLGDFHSMMEEWQQADGHGLQLDLEPLFAEGSMPYEAFMDCVVQSYDLDPLPGFTDVAVPEETDRGSKADDFDVRDFFALDEEQATTHAGALSAFPHGAGMNRSDLEARFNIGQASGVGLNCLLHSVLQQVPNLDANDQTVAVLRRELVAAGLAPAFGGLDIYAVNNQTNETMTAALTRNFNIRLQIIQEMEPGAYAEHPVIGEHETDPLVRILHTGPDSDQGHFVPLWPRL
ncbi:hypothetical protein [uncultured Roseibium sp.]|uniref:hypothetical protein n=1 Tax=uncultured Roseibium sp. TaxID=1936171 RepID=UPI002628EE93|nr:hypothetical protein [uncultured Roseibium sp.]